MSGDDCKSVGLRDVNVHSMPSTSSRPTTSKRSARRSGRFALCRSPGRPSSRWATSSWKASSSWLLIPLPCASAAQRTVPDAGVARPSRGRLSQRPERGSCGGPTAAASVLPDVRFPAMADQVRRAITWLYENARSFDGNSDQIYVPSHSLG